MSHRVRSSRRAFTLIELLVTMSVIVLLSAMTLLVVTNISERDGVTDAAGLTRQWLMTAKNRAGRDQAPRGIRLIVSLDPNNPAKTSPFWVTELQYIESPPMLLPTNPSYGPTDPSAPCVEFFYTFTGGAITGRQCVIDNLLPNDAQLIIGTFPPGNALLTLSSLPNGAGTGPFSARMTSLISVSPGTTTLPIPTVKLTVGLDLFPDPDLGAGSASAGLPLIVVYQFGIACPPRPLLGEPALQLPKNICIDLSQFAAPNGPTNVPQFQNPSVPQGVSNPSPPPPFLDYDILFTPTGHVMPYGAGATTDQIFLWHRDYTKLKNAPNGNNALVVTNLAPVTYDMYPFQNGGVQQLVFIRCKTGSLGQFPVLWPNPNGQYVGEDPYTFARQGATSP